MQRIHGLTSCSEWTGVPVATLLRECGVQPDATWVLAEGADAVQARPQHPDRRRCMDDAMVVYGQNGEPLRPEQGYPLRLLPARLGRQREREVAAPAQGDGPAGDDAARKRRSYTDLMPDGTARQFTFDMEPKSLITRPSGGDTLAGRGSTS